MERRRRRKRKKSAFPSLSTLSHVAFPQSVMIMVFAERHGGGSGCHGREGGREGVAEGVGGGER